MTELRLAAGLLEREGKLLLVASRYPNLAEPLWHLPGGRARPTELLEETLRREFTEETGLRVEEEHLLYVSESFDQVGGVHVLSLIFRVRAHGEARLPLNDAHVVDQAWLTHAQALRRITVPAVREPLAAYLRGDERRYHAFPDAGVTIRFADQP